MRLEWTVRAAREAGDAVEWIARDRPAAAARWLARSERRVGRLAAQPTLGRVVPEAGRDRIREIQVPPYRVIYRCDPGRVIILTVHHARRTMDSHDLGA